MQQSPSNGIDINGTFERLAGSEPAGWKPYTWSGKASFAVANPAAGGARSVSVHSDTGADAAWTTVVPVDPWSTYTLRARIRTVNVQRTEGTDPGARINLHARPEHTRAIVGTTDWTEVELTVETGADDALQINCLLGWFGRCSGTAFFDDIRLIKTSGKTLAATARVASQPLPDPISPYLYGQFLEHMGRCIYGGIWAEMLEDRKFFHPVGGRDSPWKPVGRANASLDTKDSWVNDRSPRVDAAEAGAGLAQGALVLQRGREYKLRLRVRSATPLSVVVDGRKVAAIPPGKGWRRWDGGFRAIGDSAKATLAVVADAPGIFHVGAVSLMPADNIQGFRRDTLERLRDLDSPLYRWPGGNFVSGYDWRDGLGDPDRRPTRKNPAWQGIDSNDVGIHEFLELCRLLKTEPMIVVNTGFGDAHSAAEEVEYVNGSASSPNGAWRARNGRREPWKVRWWGVGNEMWGNWQLGYMAVDQYVVKHNLVERAMRRVDPSIRTVASGELGGGWSERMLRDCQNSMDLISEHFYCQERPGVMGHVRAVPEAIKSKADAHRRLRETVPGLKGRGIKIAMDEWNYWYGPHVFGELGTRYFWKDALGIAAGLHEYFRNTDIIEMANYAQTVNVIGAIKTTATEAWLETTGLVLSLYRRQFGNLPLKVDGGFEPLDVAAALTSNRSHLTIGVVNPSRNPVPLNLRLPEGTPPGSAVLWRLSHPDPQAYNDAGKTPVQIRRIDNAPLVSGAVEIPGLSVSIWRMPWKGTTR